MTMVREITVDDWAALRDVRLAALSEAPYAFGSTYAREAAFSEERWRMRISEWSVTFFAETGPAGPAGIAGIFVEDGDADLVSMWVRPSARGRGVGDALVEAAASWARERGYPELFLWVTESNTPARWLYRRLGFAATGERQPLPSDPARPEIRMSRPL